MKRTDEEIIAAYERWVNRLSKSEQDKPILFCLCPPPGKNKWTPRDLLNSMKDKSDCFKDLPNSIRLMADGMKKDPVEMIDNFPSHL